MTFEEGQLAEQRHQVMDLDADSTCRDIPAIAVVYRTAVVFGKAKVFGTEERPA